MKTDIKIKKTLNKAVKEFLNLCIKENVESPNWVVDVEVSNGQKYKLTFERVDLDDLEVNP